MVATAWTRATGWIDREWSKRLADWFAVGIAVALPWSTSFAIIFSVLWLVAFVPTIDPAGLRRAVTSPAGGLPVLFFVLFAVGMLWAVGVPMAERLEAARSVYKLLFIPLFIAHFMRSERGAWVLVGYLVSCGVLLVASYLTLLMPEATSGIIPLKAGAGIPVRDYIAQSNEFTVCFFLLAAVALTAWRDGRRASATAMAVLCVGFLLNMFVIVTSRTALVILPVLLLVFALRHLSRAGVLAVGMAGLVIAALVGTLTPKVRNSVVDLFTEIRDYDPAAIGTRAGERIQFWTKSIVSVSSAPLIGHGTGSIREEFRKQSVGDNRFTMQTMVTSNPHNQTLATAIQLGLVGTAVMIAMWLAHLLLFWRGAGLAAWAGVVIVTQNIVGSLFNAHLFDFLQGWGYVLGVGVAAGVMMKREAAVNAPPPRPGSVP
jgi:O-antigen ligase